MRWLSLLPLILTVGCALRRPSDEEKYAIEHSRLAAGDRELVKHILADPSSIAKLEEVDVKSSRELFKFLMEELEFAAACAKAMGEWEYSVTREGEVTTIEDGKGLKMLQRSIYEDSERWGYLSEGHYSAGLFGTLTGDILVVIHSISEGGALKTSGIIYLRVRDGLGSFAAGMMPRFFRTLMSRKGSIFTEAARKVAEEATLDPAAFYGKMKGAEGVDLEALEKFRRAFVE